MNTLRDSRLSDQKAPGGVKRSRSLAVSIVLHAIIISVLVRFLVSPAAFTMIFGRAHTPEVPTERIGFLRLPTANGPAVAGRSGGDNRPLSKIPPRKLVAPTTVPSALPPAPAQPQPAVQEEGGSGPLVGSGGPAQGIRPTYTGPRVWAAPGEIVTAPKSAKEKMDSAIASIVAPFNDSVRTAGEGRKPGDWTIERDGRKYGIDPQYIRLGKISIPTAILALLPINTTGNPIVNDRNRLQNQLHADIFWNAQRGMNEADFKKAVKSIRERKERERAAQKKAQEAEQQPPAQSDKN